ncbi:MAG: helix-turn-helix transcriptional regulator [Nannocystaceae bacterium]|nr:helix-turn-helix transcriptional regulator [Nannocystaceae bacterium]
MAAALDVVGDRWSLVLLRDVLLHGTIRFGQLKDAAERISTNILTDRLRQLEAAGLITATPYQERPLRHEYSATDKGRDMLPAIEALATWGREHVQGVSRGTLVLGRGACSRSK